MAWSWKTFGKVAAGVALIGLGTVTGGATLGAAGAVLGSLAGATYLAIAHVLRLQAYVLARQLIVDRFFKRG